MSTLNLSKSSVGMYLHCPLSFYLKYLQHFGNVTDYPRLLGSTVHQFIAGLYRKHKDPSQPFYYGDIEKARGAWFYNWGKVLKEQGATIRFPDANTAEQCGVTGWVCICNYWRDNILKPPPVYVEKRFTYPIMAGVNFVGIFDQIRTASPSSIAKFRPELVTNGVLIGGIDPVFLVDLKTNRYGYDMTAFKPAASPLEQAAFQFELHEDLQVTAYYWLYYQIFQKLPAGFFWYHLRSGKWFYTYRTTADFKTFVDQVMYVVNGLNAQQFPKIVGPSCRYCDYVEACAAMRPDRPLAFCKPSMGVDEAPVQNVATTVTVVKSKQRRFKLTVERVKKVKKEARPRNTRQATLLLPADEDESR